RVRENRQHSQVDVYDTGVGLPEDKFSCIFEPFFTNKGALGGSKLNGIGLGLAISRSIVQMHNGEIKVQSRVGEGSCFSLVLPYCEPREQLVSNSLAQSIQASTALPSLRILVVEDEPDVRMFLSSL